ncbi:MAG: [FeFe] hydrogenase H-cluster radical SAM maturase HydE [Ruminococcaceae bacterium]|nr:[FeFe] hydrogenase H-cluster radical SAM maturase HydE [Oscillospiraceae bacterium]
MNNVLRLIDKLEKEHSLTVQEYEELIEWRDDEAAKILAQKADSVRKGIYSNKVYVRGLIEVSNICKNNCLYCGIRSGNKSCERYRLTKEDILECCEAGYRIGFRTFVMQGGEDPYFTDEVLSDIITEIKKRYPDAAVTLSLGERSYESYRILKEAGADRYLLRHETANEMHYGKLHPKEMSYSNRMNCLRNLREIGFQVGCGFMVGSPYQEESYIANDLKFIEEFKPDMCGIGPFIPHKDTPFRDEKAGDPSFTCYLLSIIRLIHPPILLPATTALGSISGDGRERGIMAGANVIMPNLSPQNVRRKYELYNNKLYSGDEAAEALESLKKKMLSIGYEISTERGDIKK